MRKALLVVVLLSGAVPAMAQEGASVAGGYAYMEEQSLEWEFTGFFASISGSVAPGVAIVGEFGGYGATLDVAFAEVDISLYTFMGGPRFYLPNSRVSPFAELLAGGFRGSAELFGSSAANTEFAIQPAGGLHIWLTNNIGVRGSAYFRRVFEGEGRNHAGVMVGLIVGGGM